MKYRLFILSFLFLFLSSCQHTVLDTKTVFDNSFYPWPTGTDYSAFIDCNKSYFICNYDGDYNYVLMYRNGDIVSYSGKYYYAKESFFLEYKGENVVELNRYNYFKYHEHITYEEKEYTIIWQAKRIFH